MNEETVARIRELNDRLRETGRGGSIVCTRAVSDLSIEETGEVIKLIRSFNDFTEDNDPYGEHSFGSVEYNGQKYFWKIDYYDLTFTKGSEDPSDPSKTNRVMTIMTSQEY